jgi:hypothetical protein
MIQQPNEKTTVLELYRQMSQGVPFLMGKELSVETAATVAAQKFPHGLGRAYRGAWQLKATDTSLAIVFAPETQSDSDVNLTFVDAVGVASTVTFWIW